MPSAINTPNAKHSEIIEAYHSGMPVTKIASKVGRSYSGVIWTINKFSSLRPRPKCTDSKQEREIIAHYKSGMTVRESGLNVKVSEAVARRVIRDSRIEMRSGSVARRKYTCDHAFFSRVNSDEKAAYWAGFIAADGCIRQDKRSNTNDSLAIQLAGIDTDHLRQFIFDIKSTHPVIVKGRETYRCGVSAVVSIASQQICDDLRLIGVTPVKTFTLKWPNLPNQMLKHYLRGYFDGDGCWSVLQGATCLFEVTGNLGFVKAAQLFLMRHCNLNQTKIQLHASSDGIGRVRYGGNRQCARIAHFLYDDSTVYLRRKYNKVSSYLRLQQESD